MVWEGRHREVSPYPDQSPDLQKLHAALVKEGVLPKKLLQEDLANFAKELHTRPGINPAQRGAAILLKSLETLLNTADRSDAH